jgi:UrcA family protein
MSLMNRNGVLGGLAAAPVMTALLCAATFITTGASAATLTVKSVNVSYVAADLTRPESAQKLYVRIQRAARVVCREPDIRDLPVRPAYLQCYNQAVDNAVATVNASALTALHRSKTQRGSTG